MEDLRHPQVLNLLSWPDSRSRRPDVRCANRVGKPAIPPRAACITGLSCASPRVCEATVGDDRDHHFRAGLAAIAPVLSPHTVDQPGSPVLIAICYCFPTSVTTCGGMGSPGALSNSSRTTALPSVNNSTVTALAPSGEVPEATVPPVPTGHG